MGKYTVIITKQVQKQLSQLPNHIAEIMEAKMLELEDNPKPNGSIKLSGREAYRIRQGNYRFIYEIQNTILIIRIIKIAHRKDIYR